MGLIVTDERSAFSVELPDWAQVSGKRRGHIARVTALLVEWADRMGVAAEERTAWIDAGRFHDALKDAPDDELRAWLRAVLARALVDAIRRFARQKGPRIRSLEAAIAQSSAKLEDVVRKSFELAVMAPSRSAAARSTPGGTIST